MSSRALRKQKRKDKKEQRNKQIEDMERARLEKEREELANIEQAQESDDSDEEVEARPKGFAGLQQAQHHDVSDEEEEQAVSSPASPEESKQPVATVSTKLVHSDQVAKHKESDDLDQILSELGEHQPSAAVEEEKIDYLLRLNPKNLHKDDEHAKLMGNKVSVKKQIHKSRRKLWLTPGREEWPQNIKWIPKMEKSLETGRFYFDITKHYQQTLGQFLEMVETNDPNALNDFQRMFPFHIGAMYRYAIFMKLQGRFDQVEVLLEQVIYAYQMAFHHQFSPLLGRCELDLNANTLCENFYHSIFYYIECLNSKGCTKAAFEFSKFLLSLDPREDPLGAIFLIEFYALRAKEFGWFRQFATYFTEEFGVPGSLLGAPDILYTYALAAAMEILRTSEGDPAALSGETQVVVPTVGTLLELSRCHPTAILCTAIAKYPGFANAIMTVLSPTTPLLEVAAEPEDSPLPHVATIYGQKAGNLWKDPEIAKWYKRCFSNYTGYADLAQSLDWTTIDQTRYVKLSPDEFVEGGSNVIPPEMMMEMPQAMMGDFQNVDVREMLTQLLGQGADPSLLENMEQFIGEGQEDFDEPI